MSAKVKIVHATWLDCSNIRAAIEAAQPYGVDVNSGVESSPGRKDHALIRKIVQIVHETTF